MNSILESTPQMRAQTGVIEEKPLYRTNTFPRRKPQTWKRSSSDGVTTLSKARQDLHVHIQSDVVAEPPQRRFRRGLSEHFHRIGKGTFEKIGKVNRAKRLMELEVVEACAWLQEAGFPQYVQLFDDCQFPIDIKSVEKDHTFLDQHLLHSLYRRLNTLNKSIHMKLDINSKKPLYGSGLEEDEDDTCVLSDKWHYERASGRWSHIDSRTTADSLAIKSCSSKDSVMSDETADGADAADSSSSPVLHFKKIDGYKDKTDSSNKDNKYIQYSDKKRSGSFFQRVGSLRRSAKKTNKERPTISGDVTISGPKLLNRDDMSERMRALGCVEIVTAENHHDDIFNNNTKLIRSASVDGPQCICDRCSVDSMVTEYMLPPDYVFGTFPKELVESQVKSRKSSISSSTRTKQYHNYHQCSQASYTARSPSNQLTVPEASTKRNSLYDNVPEVESPPLTPEPVKREVVSEAARRELDDVLFDLLKNISEFDVECGDNSTSSNIMSLLSTTETEVSSTHLNVDSAVVSPTSEDLSSLTDSPSELIDTPELKRPSRHHLTTSSEEIAVDDISGNSENLTENNAGENSKETVWRERRDSGVGSSLTREPLDRRKKSRFRWHSFVASHRPSFNSQNQHVSSLSAAHVMYLKKLSLLKVTSLMEQYSPSHKTGFTLQLVNKFIKKNSRTPDYNDKKVFAVPLSVILQRTGQPLPQCILHAMRYLRKSASDSVGIFRKSGVKSRIAKLRNDLESDPDNLTQFESVQAYDVADMFKQYLRELPECLVTNKLSDTFLAIYQHIPQEHRLEALQACILLLPDENREVLETLLYFLSDMASYHEENQMTASNLAMCFAPSLFNIHNRSQSKSPKSDRKNTGIPDQKEFQDQKSATDCLTSMITDCKRLFKMPDDFLSKCTLSYMEISEPVPLSLIKGESGYESHIESCLQGLLKESREKGWCSMPNPDTSCNRDVDFSYKKVHDGNPLRLWKCSTEIEAPPIEVLQRILKERQKWDDDLNEWRVVETLDKQVDVFQYLINCMAPQPAREYLVLRAWKTDLPKGACALVMHSIDYDTKSLGSGSVRSIVLASHYLVEPSGSGKSKVTHISRVDTRGREAKWYNRCYGSMAASDLVKVRDSFTKVLAASTNVHETKV